MSSLQEILRRHVKDDVHALAMRDKWFESYDKMWLLQQIQARQKAELKLPSWYGNFNLLFPPPLSVEQCSSELTARYKASLVTGDSLLDMTGGMGIDSSSFATRFQHVTFIEQQETVAEVAAHNFKALHLDNVTVIAGNCAERIHQLPAVDCIYLDPARRNEKQKVFFIEDCQPNLLELFSTIQQKCKVLMVKLSPMLDISFIVKTLPALTQIHVVAVHHEIKELLLLFHFDEPQPLRLHCVNLEKECEQHEVFDFTERNQPIAIASAIDNYLYEPHPTLLKSEMMNAYAQRHHLKKLHSNSHLYTSDQLVNNFFGRTFKVEEFFTMNKSSLKQGLATITGANITTRNFPLSEGELRKRLKIPAGGSITLFATTLAPKQHILIKTQKIDSST